VLIYNYNLINMGSCATPKSKKSEKSVITFSKVSKIPNININNLENEQFLITSRLQSSKTMKIPKIKLGSPKLGRVSPLMDLSKGSVGSSFIDGPKGSLGSSFIEASKGKLESSFRDGPKGKLELSFRNGAKGGLNSSASGPTLSKGSKIQNNIILTSESPIPGSLSTSPVLSLSSPRMSSPSLKFNKLSPSNLKKSARAINLSPSSDAIEAIVE
jgi:hypothetical protein